MKVVGILFKKNFWGFYPNPFLYLFFFIIFTCLLNSGCGNQVPFQFLNTLPVQMNFGTSGNTAANTALKTTTLNLLVSCNGKPYPLFTVVAGKAIPLIQGTNCNITLVSFMIDSSQEVFSATNTPATLGNVIATGSYQGSLGNTATIIPSVTAGDLTNLQKETAVFFDYQSSNTVTVAKESNYTYFGVVNGQSGTFQLTFSTISGVVSYLTLTTSSLPTGFSVNQSSCTEVNTSGSCVITLTYSPTAIHSSVQALLLPYVYTTDDNATHSSQVSLSYQGLNRIKWSFPTSSTVQAKPVLNPSETALYFSSNDGKVYSVNTTTGNQNWFYPMPSGTPMAPILDKAGATLYVGSSTARVAALNAATGTQVWLNTNNDCLTASGAFYVKPTLSTDETKLFVPCYNPQMIVAFSTISYAGGAISPSTKIWKTGTLPSVGVSPVVTALNGLSLFISGVSNIMIYKYTGINNPNNDSTAPTIANSTANIGSPAQGVVLLNADNSIAYIGSCGAATTNRLYAYNTNDLSQKWSSATIGGVVGGGVGGTLSSDEKTIYLSSDDYRVYAFDANQIQGATNVAPKWITKTTEKTGTWYGTVALSPDGKTIYAPGGSGIYTYDANTGNLKWSFTTPAAQTAASPVVAANGNTIYFGSSNNSVYALNADVVKY